VVEDSAKMADLLHRGLIEEGDVGFQRRHRRDVSYSVGGPSLPAPTRSSNEAVSFLLARTD
jgi:hypothetical protein